MISKLLGAKTEKSIYIYERNHYIFSEMYGLKKV